MQNFNHLHAEQQHLNPFQDCKRLELREAIFSPEMIWEAVPQCRCSKSERVFTVPCILHIDAGRGPGGNASLGSHRHPHAS